jgi:pimeloyl-ACP methyl ester carboxylesterase
MDDLVVGVLSELVPGGVRRGDLRRGSRTLRWVEAGSGGPTVVFDAALAEPGSLAWAAVLPAVAEHTRVVAYDRAGAGGAACWPSWSPLTTRTWSRA